MQIVCTVLLLLGSNAVFATEPKNQDVYAEIQTLKTEIKQLKLEMAQCRILINTNVTDNTEKKRNIFAGSAHVAFYAHLSHHIDNVGHHQPIVFDVVRTNQGNSYSRIDGEFTAPVDGTYFFIWTTSNRDNSYMQTELIVNGVVFGQIVSDAMNHMDWAVATGFTIVQLYTGDRVWIQSGDNLSGHISGVGLATSSFAGFLLW